MRKLLQIRFLGLMVVGLLIASLLSCNPLVNQSSVQSSSSTLLVSAAASLQQALQEVAPLYEQAKSNQTVKYNFAASGAIQQQIEQGAPTDVFISAANKQMDALQQKDLIVPDTRRNLLTNRLVLIAPKNSTVKLTGFEQLANSEVKRIAIGEPRSVPAGQYATEVLQKLGILEQVQSKFVLGNSVKSVLAAVETGDVQAGIVYATDAKLSDKVSIVTTAEEKLHKPIVYPIAVTRSSKSPDLAKQYVEFLQSESAKTVFEKYGFGIATGVKS